MPKSKVVFKRIVDQITIGEPIDEIQSIAYLLMEHIYGVSKSQVMADRELREVGDEELNKLVTRINEDEPIQYIIGKQDFYGRSFIVNRSVLIPRPETEELVKCVIDFSKKHPNPELEMLDIGTGSGCIPITLSLELENLNATGLDFSEDAIRVARRNNDRHKTNVTFFVSDILKNPLNEKKYDIIVSNPPYVVEREKPTMSSNVLNFEPYHALFVPNDDPLRFYKSIAEKGKSALTSKGLIAVEINEKFGREVAHIFEIHSFKSIRICKDLSGKDRIVSAIQE